MEHVEKRGKEISLEEFKSVIRNYATYLFSKKQWIILIVLIAGISGAVYAWMQKPVYVAELTFAAETENSSGLGTFAGLVTQFGIGSGGGASAFEGENLIELLHSRKLLEKTLLTPVAAPDGSKQLLLNYYIKKKQLDKAWSKTPGLSKVVFTSADTANRQLDSIMKLFCRNFGKQLQIGRIDKRSDIFLASMSNEDEFFAKSFLEQLVNNVIQFYVDYKSKKSRQNVDILRRQTDSIRVLLSGNIVDIAISNDLNVNPIRQIMQTNVQRKRVDVQVNEALYSELVKNLELSKMALRKETPLIQVIDSPKYPLDTKKMATLKGAALFAFIAGAFTIAFFFFKKFLEL